MKATRAGCSVIIRTATLYSFSECGLTLPAYAWNINRSVDLTPIKVKWESLWNKLTCYTVEFEHRDGESKEELQTRQDEVSRQVREAHGLEQSFSGRSDETGDVFQPDPAFGAIVSRVLSVEVVERDEEIQRIVGNIFLDILRHLHYNCEVSLANSIWHSVRAECVVRKEGSSPVEDAAPLGAFPDDVGDLLTNPGLLSLNPRSLLQLHLNDHGTYNQIWLIDRIMREGYFGLEDIRHYTIMAS